MCLNGEILTSHVRASRVRMHGCELGRGEETRVLKGREEPLDGDIAVCRSVL